MGLTPTRTSNQDAQANASFEVLEQAAHWYVKLLGEDVCAHDREAWQTWLKQSADHSRAWAHIEAVSKRFDPLRDTGEEAAVAAIDAARDGLLKRRQALKTLVGIVGIGVAGWVAWRHTPLPGAVLAWQADYRTDTGERQTIRLTDGSQVWLNTATAMNVDTEGEVRRIELLAGEILVQTAKDALDRPFYVDTHRGRLQALGTRFTVRDDSNSVRLDVFEGAVEVRNAAGLTQRIKAGRRTVFTDTDIAPTAAAERTREAWHKGLVVADNLSLQQLVDELSRYRFGYINVAPDVAQLSVMGVYPADDPDRALAMLESSLAIRVQRHLPWWISIRAR